VGLCIYPSCEVMAKLERIGAVGWEEKGLVIDHSFGGPAPSDSSSPLFSIIVKH